MIVPVNGLETGLNNVSNMMANIMEQLDKALPGLSGTRDVPAGQPHQVLHTASSPILQELHDPEEVEREKQDIARHRAEELARNSKVNGEWARTASQVVGNRNENPWGTVLKGYLTRKLTLVKGWGRIRTKHPRVGYNPRPAKWHLLTANPDSESAAGFKMPFVKRYDRESDPQEHINSYVQVMIDVDASNALMCRCFLQTVDSKVADWVNHIPPRSILTWDELGLRFLEHFAGNCRPKKHFTHLASDGLLHTDLTTHPPDTFKEAMVRAGRYVTLEEGKEEKKEKTHKEEEKAGNKKPFKNKKQGFPDGPKGTGPRTSEKHKSANPVFTLAMAEVMAHAAQQGLMTYPTYSQKVCNVEDTGKWCAYHRKNDHNTEDCYTLKNEMARLICRGALLPKGHGRRSSQLVAASNGKCRDKEVAQAEAQEKRHIRLEDEEEDSEPAPHRQKRQHRCNFIIGGNTGGDSATSQKKWANAAMVNKVLVPEGKKLKTEPIVFSNADLPKTGVPHRDALVITIDIMDLFIHKTLVDTGSSVNIMYMDTYKALVLTRDELSPIKTLLTGFTNDSIEPEGATKQPIKYDTQVGEVTAQLLRAEERRPRIEVVGNVEEVELEPGTPGRLVRIGKGLGAKLRSRVISVLRRFRKVFAWSRADMPGLDHKLAVHRLNVLRDPKPVKQKRKHLSQERREFVKKEVATLQSIGHIREVHYPDWLTNVVLAPKPPSWRMCIDYTDLNKACPMDPFPLPNID
ncbi:unnamed protein product [Cuscuta campestris]|uniref:Retrotransposon gag domain-containing protein n=1 Tax=Cuscuta campestris TaxID=132261 RepID=A0A484MQQ6_9ASTE|nr:unnamed protein product [Cuscuta campestris]